PDGRFGRDFSWAVMDPKSYGGFKLKLPNFSDDKPDDELRWSTGAMTVVAHCQPCRLEILDSAGHVLVCDAPRGMACQDSGNPATQPGSAPAASAPSEHPMGARAVRVWQTLPVGTAIYGLGEKTGPMNKRGGSYTMWNTDALYGPGQDP